MMYKKCMTCPYKLGLIKCLRDPCIDCVMNNRKEHPFGFLTKGQVKICPKCGSKRFENGKCVICGVKESR